MGFTLFEAFFFDVNSWWFDLCAIQYSETNRSLFYIQHLDEKWGLDLFFFTIIEYED